jgi:hypothetical protein
MKGFIRRRGDAWELRVFLGTDPVTNKMRYASRTVRTGRREAQRVLNEMVSDADHATHVHANAAACRITLADDAFVFSNEVDGSEPWYPDTVSRSFKRLCERPRARRR